MLSTVRRCSLNRFLGERQEPITRSVIVFTSCHQQSRKSVYFWIPISREKQLPWWLPQKRRIGADKLLARSTISWSDVTKSHIVIGQITHPLFVSRKKGNLKINTFATVITLLMSHLSSPLPWGVLSLY